MSGTGALAFMNLGWTELVVVAVVALLLFGPRLGRTLGQVGGTMLKLKRGVDDAKQGLTGAIAKQLESAVIGPEKPAAKATEKPALEPAEVVGEKPTPEDRKPASPGAER